MFHYCLFGGDGGRGSLNDNERGLMNVSASGHAWAASAMSTCCVLIVLLGAVFCELKNIFFIPPEG